MAAPQCLFAALIAFRFLRTCLAALAGLVILTARLRLLLAVATLGAARTGLLILLRLILGAGLVLACLVFTGRTRMIAALGSIVPACLVFLVHVDLLVDVDCD